MLTNYLRVAFRQLWRNKTFSAFNIFGLATSMSVCLLVLLILFDQYGYDKFHVDSERIHRIISGDDQYEQVVPRMATAPLDLAEELRQYDAVAHSTQIIPLDRSISHEREPLALRKNGLIIEPSFFSIFTFGWTEQQGMDALGQPATVVITEATAERWFPSQEALGKQVNIYGVGDCTITGIMPTPPRRSHLQFDYLLGKATINALSTAEREAIGLAERNFRNTYRGYVYFKTVDEGSIVQLQSPLTQLAESYTAQTENRYFAFATQPLLDILPSQDLGNEIGIGTPLVIIYFVLSIGLIILLTACFNYTNLTLAKSLQRAREIGVRKVNGARRGQIVRQFLTESVVVAFLSLLVAVVLLEFLIPAFYGLHPFVEDIFYLDKPWFTYPLFFSFSLMVGLLAGALPSWSIARLQPLTALGKLQNARIFSKVGLRKALITFQFTLALICILLVILVVQQKNHVLQADLGIDINEHRSLNLFELDYEVLSQRIGQLPGVTSVAGINSVIFGGYRDTQLGYNQGGDSLRVGYLQVSANYPEHLGMEFLAGGTFPTTSSGQEQFIVLNEIAAQRLGYADVANAVGQSVTIDSVNLQITGVVKNFHYDNIWFEAIQPFALRQVTASPRFLSVQLTPGQNAATMEAIRGEWATLAPDQPLSAQITQDGVFYMSRFFRMGSRIIGFVGFLAILISCLGLLGTVLYSVQGRLKEISIRKVLGATVQHLTWRLSRGFLSLLFLAAAIGIPLVWLGGNWWLSNFHLRTEMAWWLPLLGLGITLVVGLLVILPQTYWTAIRNPAETLKTE